MLSFCEVRGVRVQCATQRDEKGPHALQELTISCKRQDSDTDLSSYRRMSSYKWQQLGTPGTWELQAQSQTQRLEMPAYRAQDSLGHI